MGHFAFEVLERLFEVGVGPAADTGGWAVVRAGRPRGRGGIWLGGLVRKTAELAMDTEPHLLEDDFVALELPEGLR